MSLLQRWTSPCDLVSLQDIPRTCRGTWLRLAADQCQSRFPIGTAGKGCQPFAALAADAYITQGQLEQARADANKQEGALLSRIHSLEAGLGAAQELMQSHETHIAAAAAELVTAADEVAQLREQLAAEQQRG